MSNTGVVFLLVCGCTILYFALIIGVYRYFKVEAQNEQLKQHAMLQEVHLQEIALMKAEILQMIEQIESKIDDHEALEKMEQTYLQRYHPSFCGCPVLDALLSFKKMNGGKSGISVDIRMENLPELSVSEEELTALIGNLLDNALEAAQKCQRKWVSITAKTRKGQWVLIVENSKLEEEHPLDTGMQTTKDDVANHGLGTKIINHIVRKNKGTILKKDAGEAFCITVAFDVAKEKK